jgi:hypothetical protein
MPSNDRKISITFDGKRANLATLNPVWYLIGKENRAKSCRWQTHDNFATPTELLGGLKPL